MNRIYLVRKDPDKNMNRFYKLIIAETLFGQWALIREWGRIGSPGTVKEDRFETADLAIRSARKLAGQKVRRGYKSLYITHSVINAAG